MTEYYILLPDDDINDLTDANLLGTVGLRQIFWIGEGYKALTNMVKMKHPIIEEVMIINNKGTKMSINEFLNMIETLTVKSK